RPSSVTWLPPSMTMLRSVGRSIVIEMPMVAGAVPQLKVTTALDATAARSAASVQLWGVPSPTLGAMPAVRVAAGGGVRTCAVVEGAGGIADAATWHSLTMPYAGSAPNQSLLHCPAPVTDFVIHDVPVPSR